MKIESRTSAILAEGLIREIEFAGKKDHIIIVPDLQGKLAIIADITPIPRIK